MSVLWRKGRHLSPSAAIRTSRQLISQLPLHFVPRAPSTFLVASMACPDGAHKSETYRSLRSLSRSTSAVGRHNKISNLMRSTRGSSAPAFTDVGVLIVACVLPSLERRESWKLVQSCRNRSHNDQSPLHQRRQIRNARHQARLVCDG